MVKNCNSANDFILYGRGGEITTNRIEDQEATMLSLHLLRNCMVFVNTLMIQRVLSEPVWMKCMARQSGAVSHQWPGGMSTRMARFIST